MYFPWSWRGRTTQENKVITEKMNTPSRKSRWKMGTCRNLDLRLKVSARMTDSVTAEVALRMDVSTCLKPFEMVKSTYPNQVKDLGIRVAKSTGRIIET